jgi:pyruvate/2-oxoglutarate/acetoin dehydrogenase E1 component
MIIEKFRKYLQKNLIKKFIVFGQNVTFGSRISGLTHEIEKNKTVKIYNTQNSEATLIGFGLGIMMNKKYAIYFAKQLDFLLLGMDHIVNTYNNILHKKYLGGFSIITYIVDSGFEGPQSRLHSLQDIASISYVDCNYLVFPADIEINLKKITKNKFNIFCISQKNFKNIENPRLLRSFSKQDIFQYNKGRNGTFLAIGFSAYKALEIIKKKKFDVDFYVVTNPVFRIDNKLLNTIVQKKYLFIFEDSRSKIKNYDHICKKILSKKPNFNIKIFRRDENENKLQVNEDLYNINL